MDANISVRHKNADKLGTRTEVKNIQSWKSLSKAIGRVYIHTQIYIRSIYRGVCAYLRM